MTAEHKHKHEPGRRRRHEHGHAGHDHAAGATQRSLKTALSLTAAFLVVELVGGIATQSLALISDAAHMFTDAAALAIALLAIQIAKRPTDSRRTFGYHRFEILAAAFNAMLLFGVAVYILYAAYLRVSSPAEIHSTGMLVIAAIGLAVNLLSMRVLHSDQKDSLNVRGAYLEVWADMISSVGVIFGALVLKITGWAWVDSAVAILIGLWVVPRTWELLKSSVNILLEGVPDDVDIAVLTEKLESVAGVLSLHDLHVWSVSTGKNTLTVHLVTRPEFDADRNIVPNVRKMLAEEFGIHHITVQCEPYPCHQTDSVDHFKSATSVREAGDDEHGEPGRPHSHRH